MEYKELDAELERVARAVYSSMKDKAGAVGDDFTFKTNSVINVITTPGHAEYVDSGRKKGSMPPPSSLEKWSRNKGLNAFAVAKNIEKHGIKPKKFFYVIDEIVDGNMNKLADAAVDDVYNKIDKDLKTKGL